MAPVVGLDQALASSVRPRITPVAAEFLSAGLRYMGRTSRGVAGFWAERPEISTESEKATLPLTWPATSLLAGLAGMACGEFWAFALG